MDSIQRVCSVENCPRKFTARGYCRMHYKRFLRTGTAYREREQKKHGLSQTSEYSSWVKMHQRIHNPAHDKYVHYGGRGIKICKRWDVSFVDFYNDLGEKPDPTYSIDRIDSDGNYSCGKCGECLSNGWLLNCRWATQRQQLWNQRVRPANTSGYKGVARHGLKWRAKITNEDGYFILGSFDDIEEAAIAYDIACIFFRGEYAVTNIL